MSLCLIAAATLSSLQAQSDDEKKEGTLPELGLYVPREEGGSINLRIEERNFKLYFMDAEKKVVPPVYSSVILRYENAAKKNRGKETLILQLSPDGKYLTSGRNVKLPFDLWVNIMFKDPKDPDKKILYGRHRLRQK